MIWVRGVAPERSAGWGVDGFALVGMYEWCPSQHRAGLGSPAVCVSTPLQCCLGLELTLHQERDAALPVVEPMALVRDRDAVLLGALGPARASTIRKHVREWRKARAFCLSVSGKPWPEHIGVVLDYLHERRLEPCASSVPAAFLAALSFIEKVGAVLRVCLKLLCCETQSTS